MIVYFELLDLVLMSAGILLAVFTVAFYFGTCVGARRERIVERLLMVLHADRFQLMRAINSSSLTEFVREIEKGKHRP